jgi:hypothetical protein
MHVRFEICWRGLLASSLGGSCSSHCCPKGSGRAADPDRFISGTWRTAEEAPEVTMPLPPARLVTAAEQSWHMSAGFPEPREVPGSLPIYCVEAACRTAALDAGCESIQADPCPGLACSTDQAVEVSGRARTRPAVTATTPPPPTWPGAAAKQSWHTSGCYQTPEPCRVICQFILGQLLVHCCPRVQTQYASRSRPIYVWDLRAAQKEQLRSRHG